VEIYEIRNRSFSAASVKRRREKPRHRQEVVS
jgi:hypothetical protein